MQKRVCERHMFYGAGRYVFIKAFELRNKMTSAEKVLWEELRNRKVYKARWKPQHPIDIYIVDFYCHKI
jgi:very-short-patch-repair endonuclease